jgi:hypothetical protein
MRKLSSAKGSLHGIAASLFLPVALLVGILCIAILCSLATWMNLRVRWNVLAVAGLVAAVGVFAAWISHLVRMGALKSCTWALGRAALSVLRRPEVLLGFALLVLAIYLVDGSPLVLWDTRSIWFFRAKQMFFSGRFLPQDANDYVWAHPGYPLLFPSILAFFSALGGWDERRAAMGIAVLLASLSSLIFILARRALGRWAGALFAILPGLYLYSFLIGGYADGPVTLCLLVAVLGFWDEDSERVGWLAAFSAALIKREGLVLAFVLCLVHSVLGKPCRQRRWSRRALAFLGFLPSILHGVWVKHLGILDPYAKAKLPEKSEEIWSRFSVLWDVLRNQAWIRTPAKIGFIGLLLSLAFTRNWRREPSGTASALTGVVAVGFTYFVFMVTPFDLRWHVATAYQRVISHSYFLLALGGVLLSSAQPRN